MSAKIIPFPERQIAGENSERSDVIGGYVREASEERIYERVSRSHIGNKVITIVRIDGILQRFIRED